MTEAINQFTAFLPKMLITKSFKTLDTCIVFKFCERVNTIEHKYF